MIEIDNCRLQLRELQAKIAELRSALAIDKVCEEIEKLNDEIASDGFYNDLEKSQKVLQKVKQLNDKLKSYDELKTEYDDCLALLELASEEAQAVDELVGMVNKLSQDIDNMTLQTLLSGKYDKNNAIISLHSGAGGTEAQDWVQMLLRMYIRWAERQGYSTQTLDYLDGDEAGIKSVTVLISGLNAYGYLKSEKGVHRLVRISPFDSASRRHTSFASVEVMPEFDDDITIDIRPEDLKIDTFRASGAGGQHVNKTESAIRITHLPSGIVVSCQTERSQFQNKDTAMKMLKSKLLEIAEREKLDKIEDIKGESKDIAWGSQIRSYVFHPYNMVKDHRTSFETGNTGAVMDGDINGFINAYLKANSGG